MRIVDTQLFASARTPLRRPERKLGARGSSHSPGLLRPALCGGAAGELGLAPGTVAARPCRLHMRCLRACMTACMCACVPAYIQTDRQTDRQKGSTHTSIFVYMATLSKYDTRGVAECSAAGGWRRRRPRRPPPRSGPCLTASAEWRKTAVHAAQRSVSRPRSDTVWPSLSSSYLFEGLQTTLNEWTPQQISLWNHLVGNTLLEKLAVNDITLHYITLHDMT